METAASPRISSLSWGMLEVEGRDGAYKDAKLYPGGSREWDWTETGTSHDPGVQPADVEELLAHGAEEVVLSTGMWRRLEVRPETLELLEERGVRCHVLQTEDAVERYDALRAAGVAVGALVHSTC